MITIELTRVRARAWRGYTQNTSGFLPRRMARLEPDSAADFKKMNDACGNRIEYTDVYRDVKYQIECIRRADARKRRLFAPPTKSGHNFGWSVDIKIDETLENFRESGDPQLIVAGNGRQSLGRWMRRFGWTGIKGERWHFNHLGGHRSTVRRIDALFDLKPDNKDVQRSLNKLMSTNLLVDGILGIESGKVARKASGVLGVADGDDFGAWFRRVLTGATAHIKDV